MMSRPGTGMSPPLWETQFSSAACAAGMLAERQYDASEAAGYARPDLVQGAWLSGGSTRMDDQQHALSALLTLSG
jgi:hypothetical protein